MPKAKSKKTVRRARPSYNVKNLVFLALLALLIIPFLAIAISNNLATSKSKAAGSSCTSQEREALEMSKVLLQNAFDQKGKEWGSCKNTCARLPKDDCPCNQATLVKEYTAAKTNLANVVAALAKCDTAVVAQPPAKAPPGSDFNCNIPDPNTHEVGVALCGPVNGGGVAKCMPDGHCIGPNETFDCNRYNYAGTAKGNDRCKLEKGGGVCNATTGQCDGTQPIAQPPSSAGFDCTKPNALNQHGDVLCASGFSGAKCIVNDSQLSATDKAQGYHIGSCKYNKFDCRNKNNSGQFGDINCASGTHCEWSGVNAGQCTAVKRIAPPANLNERIQINQGSTEQKKSNCPDGQSTTQDCGKGATRNCRWHWDASSNTCQVVGCSSVCYQ